MSETKRFKMLLSELTEDESKLVGQQIEILQKSFRACESRLRSYGLEGDSVVKLIQTMKETRVMVDETINELIEKHRLPNDLKDIDGELVSAIRLMVMKSKKIRVNKERR